MFGYMSPFVAVRVSKRVDGLGSTAVSHPTIYLSISSRNCAMWLVARSSLDVSNNVFTTSGVIPLSFVGIGYWTENLFSFDTSQSRNGKTLKHS